MLNLRSILFELMENASSLLWNFRICLKHGGSKRMFIVDRKEWDRFLKIIEKIYY